MNYYVYCLADDVKLLKLKNVDADGSLSVPVFVYKGDGKPDMTDWWKRRDEFVQIGQGQSNGQDWYGAALDCIEFSRKCRDERTPFYAWDDAEQEWTKYTLMSSLIGDDWQYSEEEK